jgi:hypothetical protein
MAYQFPAWALSFYFISCKTKEVIPYAYRFILPAYNSVT